MQSVDIFKYFLIFVFVRQLLRLQTIDVFAKNCCMKQFNCHQFIPPSHFFVLSFFIKVVFNHSALAPAKAILQSNEHAEVVSPQSIQTYYL